MSPGSWTRAARTNLIVPGDVHSALERLRLTIVRVTGNEIVCHCPAHEARLGKPDVHPSFSVNTETGLFNCLAGETRVMTWDGPREIRELAGASHRVLTSRGWVDAPFYSYGEQRLWNIVIRRNGVTRTLRATAGHRWFVRVRGGRERVDYFREVTTDQLRPGHRLRSVVPPRSGTIKPSPWGIAHGIVFGDGSAPVGRVPGVVALWGDKDAQLIKYFPLSPTNRITSAGGVPGLLVRGLPRYFKQLPNIEESSSYLYGWLAGYFAADGCVDERGLPTMSSSSRENLEFVRRVCDRLGIVTYGIRQVTRVGKGSGPANLYSLSFSRKTLTASFFLLDTHRTRWEEHREVNERLGWVVVSVTPSDSVEEVFCAEVPETHNFALEGHLLTGNCFSCGYKGSFPRLAADLLNTDWDTAVTWVQAQGVIGVAHRILGRRQALEEASPEVRPVSRAALALFTEPPASELAGRDLYPEEARAYGIAWNPKHRSWVFPAYDLDTGVLLGWQEKRRKRVRNYPAGQVKTSLALFGSHLPDQSVAVVVESPIDAARISGLGLRAYALFGSNPSQTQITHLIYRTEKVIIFTDNDPAGRKAARRLIEGLYGTGVRTAVVTYTGLDEGVDPGNLPRSELVRQIDGAVSSVWWRC